MQLTHSIDIDAPPERLWALTLDVESWPDITPTMTKVELLDPGPLRLGSRARIRQPRQRPRVWTVTELREPERFVWTASFGPLRMAGSHEVSPSPEGCTNRLGLEVTGWGAGLVGRAFSRVLAGALRTENEGFKRFAETHRS